MAISHGRTSRISAGVFVMVLGLGLGACSAPAQEEKIPSAQGKDIAQSGANQEKINPEDALVKYVECMNENGITASIDGNMIKIDQSGDQAQFTNAEAACKKYMEAGVSGNGGDLGADQITEMKENAMRVSICMREKGHSDFPDPKFGDHGGQFSVDFGEETVHLENTPDLNACLKTAGMA